jgi:HSP20 family protein
MPSVTYMNQSAPFWDFLASLEQQGNNHPFSSENRNEEREHGREDEPSREVPGFDPWGLGAHLFGGQDLPHRGPPPYAHREAGPPETTVRFEGDAPEEHNEKSKEKNKENNDEEMKDNNDNGEGPSGNSGSDNEGWAGGRGRHGRCGGPRRRGPCGPGGWGGPWGHGSAHHGGPPHGGPHHRGGHHHGPHDHHHGPPRGPRGFGRRGGWGPWGRGGFFGGGGGFDPSTLATHFWNQFNDFNNETGNKATTENEDHTPDADVFDTESAFVVHISLPGAKKEDVGVNWDAEKSELSVAGVIYRPGDEEFLRSLAMSERKVGPFERKIRLGTRATPAHIDADGITAKLEDGILRVNVPKLDSGYVEIRKVDIE